MSEFFRIALVVGGFMVLTAGSIIGLTYLTNRWLANRARRQFQALAQTMHAAFIEPAPHAGPTLFRLEGVYQQQPFLVESYLSSAFTVATGNGVYARTQAVLTRVRCGERETVFSWYMTSNRKRQKVEAFLLREEK